MTGSRALALLLFLLGVAALLLGIKINAEFGTRIAADAAGKENFAYWHVITDIAGAILAISGGWFASRGLRLRSVVAFGLAFAFASYSTSALIGYGFAQRMAVEQASKINLAREAEAHKTRTKAIEDQTWWLRSTATTTGTNSLDRRTAIAESTRLVTAASANTFDKVSAADLIGDAHTGAMSYITGGSEAQVRTALIVAAALLLITAKLAGLGLAPIAWSGGGNGSGNGSQSPPNGSPPSRPHLRRRLARLSPQSVAPVKNAQPDGQKTLAKSLSEPTKGRVAEANTLPEPANPWLPLVQEFVRQCTYAADGQAIAAADLYATFCRWARGKAETLPTSVAFGRALTQIAATFGIERVIMTNNLVGYTGRALTQRPRLVATA